MPKKTPKDPPKRDFLYLVAGATAAVATGCVAYPFLAQMSPAKDVLALSTIEVPLDGVEEGQAITVMWRGSPVFIRKRTKREIEEAEKVDLAKLRDKEADADRVKKPEWLVMVGICTHLGCVPQGQKDGEVKGEYDGWFCPCHGSHYDTSGRIRKGPAPTNLAVPPYEFLSDTLIKIG